eukprot:6206383-Pleurochrysis_carterae.AAC.1
MCSRVPGSTRDSREGGNMTPRLVSVVTITCASKLEQARYPARAYGEIVSRSRDGRFVDGRSTYPIARQNIGV